VHSPSTTANLVPVPPERETSREDPGLRRQEDVFHQLPVEIRHVILESLDLTSALALRQASLSFANLGFSDQFWKSRFFPGRDLGHIFEIEPYLSSAGGQWSSIYQLVKPYAEQAWAERRSLIMSLASSMRDLVRKAGRTHCAGASADGSLGPATSWVAAGGFMGGSSTPEIFLLPGEGFRRSPVSLYQRFSRLPARTVTLFVSTVDLYGCQYVSGIRAQTVVGDEISAFALGYQHPESEVLLFDSQRHGFGILGFCLAIDGDGIRGLSVITRAGELSAWAGDHAGLPRRRLVPSSSGMDAVEALKGDFDVSVPFFWDNPDASNNRVVTGSQIAVTICGYHAAKQACRPGFNSLASRHSHGSPQISSTPI
jgi:hypothetical protein